VKYSAVLLLCFLVGQVSFAAEKFAKIRQGDVQVTAGFGSTRSINGGSTNISISGSVQHFLVDTFSLGLSASYSSSLNYDDYSVGPIFSWHFWEDGQWTTHIEEKMTYYSYRYYSSYSYSDSYWVSRTSLGLNYFIVPNVSFGPALYYSYDFGMPRGSYYGLTGSFSIYF
jgi:hypothetical protein